MSLSVANKLVFEDALLSGPGKLFVYFAEGIIRLKEPLCASFPAPQTRNSAERVPETNIGQTKPTFDDAIKGLIGSPISPRGPLIPLPL